MTELETKLLEALQIAERHLTSELYGLCYEPSPDEPLGVIRAAIAEAEAAQQQAPQPSADGWILWEGGECPVDPSLLVEVLLRCGDSNTWLAGEWYWKHDNYKGRNIIAYRIVGAPK